jgi:hypothetical protein
MEVQVEVHGQIKEQVLEQQIKDSLVEPEQI